MNKTRNFVPVNVRKQLEKIYEEFCDQIIEYHSKIKEELSKNLFSQLKQVADQHGLVFSYDDPKGIGDVDDDDLLRELCELFVNNQITLTSIWDDSSGDWDGGNRVAAFYKHCFQRVK